MRTQHYWKIHSKVALKEWGFLDDKTKRIIALDNESHEAKTFHAFTHVEAARFYEDPNYYYNQPYTFKAPY